MPGTYDPPDPLAVGDPVRASWIALLLAVIELFEGWFSDRPIHLQAGVAGLQTATYADHPYFVDYVPTEDGDVTLTYYTRTSDAATDVQASLYNVTDSIMVVDSESTAHAATTVTKEPGVVVAVEAGKVYRLQLKGSNGDHPVEAYATLL